MTSREGARSSPAVHDQSTSSEIDPPSIQERQPTHRTAFLSADNIVTIPHSNPTANHTVQLVSNISAPTSLPGQGQPMRPFEQLPQQQQEDRNAHQIQGRQATNQRHGIVNRQQGQQPQTSTLTRVNSQHQNPRARSENDEYERRRTNQHYRAHPLHNNYHFQHRPYHHQQQQQHHHRNGQQQDQQHHQGTSARSPSAQAPPTLPSIYIELRDFYRGGHHCHVPAREAVRLLESLKMSRSRHEMEDDQYSVDVTTDTMTSSNSKNRSSQAPRISKTKSDQLHSPDARESSTDGPHSLPDINRLRNNHGSCVNKILGAVDPDVILKVLEENHDLDFVFLSPVLPQTHPNYSPYLMHVVVPEGIDLLNYCMVSRQHVIRYTRGHHPSIQSLDRWRFEQKVMHKMREIPFFQNFRKIKAFNGLATGVGMRLVTRVGRRLRSKLLTCDPVLADTLILGRTMCLDMGDLIMVNIDWELTYSLAEFIEEQSMFLRERLSRLDRYITILMHLTLSTCWDDVISAGMAVEVGQRGRPTPRRTNEIRKKDREKKIKEDGGGSSLSPTSVGKGRWNEGLADNEERDQRCARLARFVYLMDCLISDTMHTIGQNSLQKIEELLSVQKSSFPSSDEIEGIVKSFYGHLQKKPKRKGDSEGSNDSSSDDDDDDDGDDDSDDEESSDSSESKEEEEREEEEDDNDDDTLKSSNIDGSSGKYESAEDHQKGKRNGGKTSKKKKTKKKKTSQGNKSKNDPENLYGKSITIKDSYGIPQQLHIIGISPINKQQQQQKQQQNQLQPQQQQQRHQSQHSLTCGYIGRHRFRTDTTTIEITDSNAVTPPVILAMGTSVVAPTTPSSSAITTDTVPGATSNSPPGAPTAKPRTRTPTPPTPRSHPAQYTTTSVDILAPTVSDGTKTNAERASNTLGTSENTSTSSSLQSSTSSSFSVLDFLSARGILFREYGHLNDLGSTVGHEGDQPPFHPLDNVFHVPELQNRPVGETNPRGDEVNNIDNIVVDDSDSLTNENDNSDAGAMGNSGNGSRHGNDVIGLALKGVSDSLVKISSHSDSSTTRTDTGRARSSETLTAVAETAKATAATYIYPPSTSSAEGESPLSSVATTSVSIVRHSESTATDDVFDGLQRILTRGITARIDVHRYSPTLSRSTLSTSPLSPQDGRWIASLPSSLQPLLPSPPTTKQGVIAKSRSGTLTCQRKGLPLALFASSDPSKHPSAQTMTSDMTSLYSSIDNSTTNAGNSHTSEWEGSPEDSKSQGSLDMKTSSTIEATCALESPGRLKNCQDSHKKKKHGNGVGLLNKNAKPRLHVAWKNEELEEIITSDQYELNASSHQAVNNTSDECDENFEDNNNEDGNAGDKDNSSMLEPWLKKFIEKMPAVSRDKIYPFLDRTNGQARCIQWRDNVLSKGQEASVYLKSKIKLVFGQVLPPNSSQNSRKQSINTTKKNDLNDIGDIINTDMLESSCVDATITSCDNSIDDETKKIDTSEADTTLSANSNILKSLIEKIDNNGNNKDKSKRVSGPLKNARPNVCQIPPKICAQNSPDMTKSLSPKTVTVSLTISSDLESSPPQLPQKGCANDGIIPISDCADSSHADSSHADSSHADVDLCSGDRRNPEAASDTHENSNKINGENRSEIDWGELWANNVKGELTNANGHAIDSINKGAECNNTNLSIHLNDHLILKAFIGNVQNVQGLAYCEHKNVTNEVKDHKTGSTELAGTVSPDARSTKTKCQNSKILKDSARKVELLKESSGKKIRFKEVDEKDKIFIDNGETASESEEGQVEEEWVLKENEVKKILKNSSHSGEPGPEQSGRRCKDGNDDGNVKFSFHDGEEIVVRCDKQEMLKASGFDNDKTAGNETGNRAEEVDRRKRIEEKRMKMRSNRDRISKFEREAFLADIKKEVKFQDVQGKKVKCDEDGHQQMTGFVGGENDKLKPNVIKKKGTVKEVDTGKATLKHIDTVGTVFKERTVKDIGAKIKDIDGKKTTLKHIDRMGTIFKDSGRNDFSNVVRNEKKIIEDVSVRKTVLKHIDKVGSMVKNHGKEEEVKSKDVVGKKSVVEDVSGRKPALKSIDEVEKMFREICVKKIRFESVDKNEKGIKMCVDKKETRVLVGEKEEVVPSDVDCEDMKQNDDEDDDNEDDVDEENDDSDDIDNKKREENDTNEEEEEDDDDEWGDDGDVERNNDYDDDNDEYDGADDEDDRDDEVESESRIIHINLLDTSDETQERDRSHSTSLQEWKSVLSVESSTFSALESDIFSLHESIKLHTEKGKQSRVAKECDTVSLNESIKVHTRKEKHTRVVNEIEVVSSNESIKVHTGKEKHKRGAKESEIVSSNESNKVHTKNETHRKIAKERDIASTDKNMKVHAKKGTHTRVVKGSGVKCASPPKPSGSRREKTDGRSEDKAKDRRNASDESDSDISSSADNDGGGGRGGSVDGGGGGGGGGSRQNSPLAKRTLKPAFHISLVQENHKTYLVPDVYDFVAMAYTIMRDIERTLESFTTLTESAPFQTFVNTSTTGTLDGNSRTVKGPSLEYRFTWNYNVISLKNNIYDHMDGMFHLMGVFTKGMGKLYRQFFRARSFKRPVKDKNIRFFATSLKRLDSQTKILERLPDCQRVGMFLVDMSLYRDTLKNLATYERDVVHKDINQEISGRIHMLIMRVLDVKEVLESQPLVTDCQFRLLSFIDHADFLMNEMEKKDVPVIAAMYDVIDRYGVPHEESTREEFESCHSSFDSVKAMQDEMKGERRDGVVKALDYNLSRDEAWIESQVNKVIRPLVRSPCLHDGSTNWTTIERVLAKAEMVTVDLVAKANFVRRVQRYLKKQESEFTELFRATEAYTNLRNAWLLLKDWDTKVMEWKTMEFVQLNVSRLNFLVFQYMEACRKLASRLPPNTVLQVLEDKMDLMLRWLNFIIEFRSPVIKPRHWLQIQDMLGVEFGVNLPLTLGNLMSIKAIEKQKVLHMVLNRARVENNVQSDFDEVVRQCQALVIPIQAKERTLIPGESAVKTFQLADSMELEEALNYLLMELERIDMSPQAGFLHEDIERQVHRIFEVLEVLVIWTEFTIKLARIRRLILRNPSFVQSLPQDVARYKTMYKDHSELLARMRNNPVAFEWCTSREINEFLQNNHDLGTNLIRSFRHAQEEERQAADQEERSEDDTIGAWVVS